MKGKIKSVQVTARGVSDLLTLEIEFKDNGNTTTEYVSVYQNYIDEKGARQWLRDLVKSRKSKKEKDAALTAALKDTEAEEI